MQHKFCTNPRNCEIDSLSRCWALALFGGNSETGFDQNTTYSIFSISITLTDEGFQNFYEVCKGHHSRHCIVLHLCDPTLQVHVKIDTLQLRASLRYNIVFTLNVIMKYGGS